MCNELYAVPFKFLIENSVSLLTKCYQTAQVGGFSDCITSAFLLDHDSFAGSFKGSSPY